MDIYQEVTLQIRDALKEDLFDSSQGFDEEKQKEIVNILKSNFNKSNEEIGKVLMGEVSIFNPDTGDIYEAPLFALPLFIGIGCQSIIPENIYLNYDINNKYIGYTEKGVFHKVNGTTKFIDFVKRNPMIILLTFILTYIILSLINQLVGLFI